MDYQEVLTAALRRPKPLSRGMQSSVMTGSAEQSADPYIGLPTQQEPGLEQVSPEDFIPNPKSLAAMAAKAAPMLAAGTIKGNVIKGQFGTSAFSSPVTSALSKYTPDDIAAVLTQRLAAGDKFSAGGVHFTPPAVGDKFKFVDMHRGNNSLIGSIPDAHDSANVQSSIRAMLLEDPDLLQRLQGEMLQKLPAGK
jgi:hypothetical protein